MSTPQTNPNEPVNAGAQPSSYPSYAQEPQPGQVQSNVNEAGQQPYQNDTFTQSGTQMPYGAPYAGTQSPYGEQPQYGAPQYGSAYIMPTTQKSLVAAALLAFFLGIFGAHNFYLGYSGKAIAQLLITLLSFGFLAFVTAIWAFVEFIMILARSGSYAHDADGVPLR